MRRKPKFVITDFQFPTIETEKRIIQAADGELFAFQCKSEDEVIAASKNADVLLVQWAPITLKVIQSLRNCAAIVRYGVGLDNIDIDAARKCGIVVRNIPDYCIDEVADHTFALAMSLMRQLPAIDRQVRNCDWSIVPPRRMFASRQSTFITIGYGRIAREVLNRARACKFNLATCDPYLPEDTYIPDDVPNLDLEEALKTADILSLNVPLGKNTKHLINEVTLSKMKPTSLLINTARGGLVDTLALAAALEQRRIAGAGLDVFEQEPLEQEHPIRQCGNAILTSHVSWYSELSGLTLQRLAAEEAVRCVRDAFVEDQQKDD